MDVSLCCEAGITVLFGASGAGKTLTLDCVAGFHKPDQGRILLDGRAVKTPERRALERDEAAILDWKKRTWPRLKKKPAERAD